MERYDVVKATEQIHISEEMQEEIIMNVQNHTKNLEDQKRNWKRRASAAAVAVLVLGAVSIPAQAVVKNMVLTRMESIPREEVKEINDIVQSKLSEADEFSREYSESEAERYKEFWQAYKEGKFPENDIAQADKAEDAPEGTLCYIRPTGVFNLPDREMTDEEILEIIDFQHKMSYAVSQSPAAQKARAEMQTKQE